MVIWVLALILGAQRLLQCNHWWVVFRTGNVGFRSDPIYQLLTGHFPWFQEQCTWGGDYPKTRSGISCRMHKNMHWCMLDERRQNTCRLAFYPIIEMGDFFWMVLSQVAAKWNIRFWVPLVTKSTDNNLYQFLEFMPWDLKKEQTTSDIIM